MPTFSTIAFLVTALSGHLAACGPEGGLEEVLSSRSSAIVNGFDDNEISGPANMPPWAPSAGSTDDMNPVVWLETPDGVCSGTYISPYHVLTVKHCFDQISTNQSPLGGGIEEGLAETVSVYPWYRGLYGGQFLTMGVKVYLHPTLDLAVLSTETPFLHQTLSIAPREALPTRSTIRSWRGRQTILRGYGYATFNPELIRDCGDHNQGGTYCLRRRYGIFDLRGQAQDVGQYVLEGRSGAGANNGDSGGPVLFRFANGAPDPPDQEYQVIGVIAATMDPSTTVLASYIDRDFINRTVCLGADWEFIRGHHDLVGAASARQLLRLGNAPADTTIGEDPRAGTQGVLCRHIQSQGAHLSTPPADMVSTEPIALVYGSGVQNPRQRVRSWLRPSGVTSLVASTVIGWDGLRIGGVTASETAIVTLYKDVPEVDPPVAQVLTTYEFQGWTSSEVTGPPEAGPVNEVAAPPDYLYWDFYVRTGGNVWGNLGGSWELVDSSQQVNHGLAPAAGPGDLGIVHSSDGQILRSLLLPGNWEDLGNPEWDIVEITGASDMFRRRSSMQAPERWNAGWSAWVPVSGAPSSIERLVGRRNLSQDHLYALQSSGRVYWWRCVGESCTWTPIDDTYGSQIFGHGTTLAP